MSLKDLYDPPDTEAELDTGTVFGGTFFQYIY